MHDILVPFGPQHPSIKEPIYFKLYLEGNQVKKADLRIGYIHRGIEKILENKNVLTALHIAEKTCGICSYAHSGCFTQAVENILNLAIPKNVKLIRTIIAELERIHSHLLWLGFLFHEIGLETLFMFFWREREKVLDLFEEITGNRIHHSINWIGTVKHHIKNKRSIISILNSIEKKVKDYTNQIRKNSIIKSRFVGVAKIPKETAIKYSLVGPTARASGVDEDIRRTGYDAYSLLDFNIVVKDEGDMMAKVLVRLEEISESSNIIKQCLKLVGKKIPKMKEYYIKRDRSIGRMEAPRGEIFYYVSVKKNKVLRAKIKTPTFNNFHIYTHLLKDISLSDVPVIVASIDPCFSCIDRLMVVKNNKCKTLTKSEFIRRYVHV